jgi:hypothetical protein
MREALDTPRVRPRVTLVSGFVAALAAGAIVLCVLGLTQRSRLVYTPGVTPFGPVLALKSNQQACVAPISLPRGASFDQVRIFAGTAGAPGPELEVRAQPAAGGAALATGRAEGGYRAVNQPAALAIRLPRVSDGRPLAICVRNMGSATVSLFGAGAIASGAAVSIDGGSPLGSDAAVRLETQHPRSLLALLPEVAQRASLFKAGVVSPALLAVLAAALLIGVPLLLGYALRNAR